MSVKVKRGLGLLLVAALAWLGQWGLSSVARNGTGSTAVDVLQAALIVGLVVATLVAFFGGLGLIAWGLLRD